MKYDTNFVIQFNFEITVFINNPKEFPDFSQTIDNVYENMGDYNSSKKRKYYTVQSTTT